MHNVGCTIYELRCTIYDVRIMKSEI